MNHRVPPATSDDVVDAVLSASRVLVAVAARSLADVADEVTLPQYRALVVLASRGPQKVAGLAGHLGVTPATATRMCDRLVRKRLVSRTHERGDRRTVRVNLSARGRTLVEAVSERRRREIEALLRSVPASARGELVRALSLLREAAGEVPEQSWSSGWDL